MFPFDLSENIRKPLVLCFQGDQKVRLGRKGLKVIYNFIKKDQYFLQF